MFSRLIAWRSFPIFDDAFITFRYGRNLAEGNGFVFNPGEWVLGTTSPLFGLVNAGIIYLGGPPEVVVPVLNIVLDVAIALLVRRMLFRSDPVAFAFFIGSFALSPLLARTTIGGMEVNLFTYVSLLSFYLYSRNRSWLAVIVAAGSYFIRPEGVLTVIVLCGSEFLIHRRIWRATLMGLVALLCVAPFLATMYALYGDFLPQSIIAKGEHPRVPPFSVLLELLAPDPVTAVISAIGFLGLYQAIAVNSPHRLLGAWFVLYVLAYMLGGPHMWSWYSFAPLCVIATCAARFASDVRIGLWNWVRDHASPLVACGVVAFWTLFAFAFGPEQVTRNVYGALKQHCQANMTTADSIFATDVGIVGYVCPSMILDGEGLVWPQALSFRSKREMIAASNPTYLLITQTKDSVEQIPGDYLNSSYDSVARFSADGSADPAHTKAPSDTWIQEYVLYRRRNR
jgi:hypothetical protein